MTAPEVNSIVFGIDKYDNDEFLMWSNIRDVIKILIKNDYEVAVRYDDCGLYVLEFESANPELGNAHIRWIYDEDFFTLLDSEEDIDFAEN